MATNGEKISTPAGDQQRQARNLIRWLLLAPLVLVTLLCCGQVALLMRPPAQPANTYSLLSADYSPWSYQRVARINATALFHDLEQNEELTPVPRGTLLATEFWPTSKATVTSSATPEPPPTVSNTPSPPEPEPTSTPTATATTPPTETPTRTLPPPPPATSTPTEESEEEPSDTPVPPTPENTATSTPTATATITPTDTIPSTPTITPIPTNTATPTPTPTYSKLHPIVENGGAAEPAGVGRCRAYFGYLNDNAFPIDIPAGPNNRLSVDVEMIAPALPASFLPGRVINAFYIEWETAGEVQWILDGRTAAVGWCNP